MIILNGCFVLAGALRFDDLEVENPTYYNYYLQLWVFLNLVWLLAAALLKMYDVRPSFELRKSVGRAFNGLILQVSVLTLILFILKWDYYSRLFFIYFYASFGPMVLLARLVFISQLRRYYLKASHRNPVMLLGHGPEAIKFYQQATENTELGLSVAAWYADENLPGVKGNLDQAKTDLNQLEISEVFCALEADDDRINEWFRIADANLMRFRYLPSLGVKNLVHAQIELYGDVPVLITRKEPLAYRHNRFLKRFFDILVTLFFCVFIFSWLFPILALVVKLSSKGPVFFKQLRSGLNNEEFYVYKFRSMVVNDEADTKQATANDSRITKVGHFLRNHNLDELPQFINVLKGQMSIVGPRPHMLNHTSAYRELIDSFMVRHLITPGITGLAQSRGLRGETPETEDMEARVKADVYYLENWSLLLDVKIILVTIWNMFSKSNGNETK
ncbi:MAG: undecaprenyl-phosphate glucose phosphotransferase [Schleiferiaceae bacterium]|nr:undecaprenyl-phosphate glucose phosphotransferase [Schleiferiaceae bacterium]